MNETPKLKLEGNEVLREADNKLIATINEDGTSKLKNSSYSKNGYPEAIEELLKDFSPIAKSEEKAEAVDKGEELDSSDPRIPKRQPERHASMGSFSPAHINYDFANMTEDEFKAKYAPSAASQLDFIAYNPSLFANCEELETTLGNLNS